MFSSSGCRMWSDTLTPEEVEHSLRAVAVLDKECGWARPLLSSRGDIIEWLKNPLGKLPSSFSPSNMEVKSLLFEIRFALELHRAGATAEYEFATGVGGSSVDFRISGAQEWLIELVSLFESDAVKRATWDREDRDGLRLFGMHLGSHSDPRQTEQGEMIKAQERIASKVFDGKRVIKFPVPRTAFHLLLVDARGYLGGGGDCYDWLQMSLGAEAARGVDPLLVKFWNCSRTKASSPIRGLFEVGNPTRAAAYVRERLHFIGFVCEESYHEGEIASFSLLFYNHHLFASSDDVKRAFLSFPLARHIPQYGLQ
jgi:hypothetical protein